MYISMCQVVKKLSIFVYLCIFICCTKDNIYKLSIMDVDECESIILEERLNYKTLVITNDSVKQQILNVLHKKNVFELCKIPPRIIITIRSKEKKHDESFIICGCHIKDNKGTTYKYEINIEEELYKIKKNMEK